MKAMKKPDGLLSISKVCDMMGEVGTNRRQRVLRRFLRIEANGGPKVLHRMGTLKHPSYMISRNALRDAHPELFSRRDAAEEATRLAAQAMLEGLDERVGEFSKTLETQVLRISRAGIKISALEARAFAAEKLCAEMRARIEALEARMKTRK